MKCHTLGGEQVTNDVPRIKRKESWNLSSGWSTASSVQIHYSRHYNESKLPPEHTCTGLEPSKTTVRMIPFTLSRQIKAEKTCILLEIGGKKIITHKKLKQTSLK